MSPKSRYPLAAIAVMLLLIAGVLTQGRRWDASASRTASQVWAADVESARDHVTPEELTAQLLRDPTSVLLVDVRLAEQYSAFHLPGATRMDLPALLGAEGEALLAGSGERTVVLYSDGMVHPAQAWTELARRGYSNVRVLEGGLSQLFTDVLTPPSLRGPVTEAGARSASAAFVTARRLYLGGGGPPSAAQRLASDPPRLSEPTVVSTAWVAQRGADIVVLDARAEGEGFAERHLPGARTAPVARLRGPRGDVPDELLPPAELARVFGELGIDAGSEVVVYSGPNPQDATQWLLALESLGHQRLAWMEGGLTAWAAEGRPLTSTLASIEPRTYQAPHPAEFPVALAEVAEASRAGAPALLDARPVVEFDGHEEREVRGGHIPGSLNRPSDADVIVDASGVWLRPRAELLAAYADLGLTPERSVIVTCRTGHRASQSWFVLRHVLGFADVGWYDGSWQEWSRHPELPNGLAATGLR